MTRSVALYFALVLTAAANLQWIVTDNIGRSGAAVAPVGYWVDTNVYALLLEMQTTNETQILDTSGNDHHAFFMPDVADGPIQNNEGTNQFGRAEYSYFLDGTNRAFRSALEPAGVADFGKYTNSSFVAWLRFGVSFGEIFSCFNVDGSNTGWSWRVGVGGGLRRIAVRRRATTFQVLYPWAVGEFNIDTWWHVALTWERQDGTNTTWLYLDGVQVGSLTDTGSYANSTNAYTIGRSSTDANSWRGFISQVGVLHYTLTSNSVYDIYQNTHPTNNLRYRE